MSWPIRLVSVDKPHKEVGDAWYVAWSVSNLSPEYERDWAGTRPPIIVRLPGFIDFCPDRVADDSDSGWVVTGIPPNLTISPSVNVSQTWHGFIRDGVISDDCEGRGFTPDGRPLLRE